MSTKPPQRLEQARVVARVQADRGLVEHVEHAHERRADLRGEADALPLAARQRLRRAIERQVVEADVDEEAEARDHRAEQRLGDGALARRAVRWPADKRAPARKVRTWRSGRRRARRCSSRPA